MVAANIIHDEIMGRQNPWAEVFKTPRHRPIFYIPNAIRAYLER